MNLNFDLFKGVSIQLKDIENAEDRAAQLASLPSVKNIWPVTVVDRPEPVVIENVDATSGTSKEQEPRLRKRYEALSKREGNGTAKAKQSIIMQQMDKLHAKGITGKGTVIAIIDTGVSHWRHLTPSFVKGSGAVISHILSRLNVPKLLAE